MRRDGVEKGWVKIGVCLESVKGMVCKGGW